jgi:hypothetical protein
VLFSRGHISINLFSLKRFLFLKAKDIALSILLVDRR